MRRMLLWPMILMLLLLTGCRGPVSIPFDPDAEGVVDVSVRSGETLHYYAVAADGRTQKTAPFEGDALTVWAVDSDCFDTYKGIDNRGRHEFINRLVDVRVWDENGSPVPRTQTLMKVLQTVSWLEHDLWEVRILRAGDAWFVYVELNVTGSSPCTLYWYDPARDGLVEVCSFNGKETVGLRVRIWRGWRRVRWNRSGRCRRRRIIPWRPLTGGTGWCCRTGALTLLARMAWSRGG